MLARYCVIYIQTKLNCGTKAISFINFSCSVVKTKCHVLLTFTKYVLKLCTRFVPSGGKQKKHKS